MDESTTHIDIAGLTHRGCIRDENEDSIFIHNCGKFVLLADGMGGHDFGALASQTALRIIKTHFQNLKLFSDPATVSKIETPSRIPKYFSTAVHQAVTLANSYVFEQNQQRDIPKYMGTTIVGGIFIPNISTITWFHIGDSRLYRLREGCLQRLTVDHSAYERWIRNGKTGKAPGRNIITRAVGTRLKVKPDISWDNYQDNDMFLLCSDGLSDMISDDTIAEIMNSHANSSEISQELIDAANSAGGRDNVSVIVCKVKNQT